MIIRKNKNTIEILKSYDATIQYLLENNINFVSSDATIHIKFYKYDDAIKTLKFIFKNHRKFYYYLAIPYKTKHKIKNKIFINYYDPNYSDQIKNYYIY